MGRPRPRRPVAVRIPDSWGRAGWTELADHPEKKGPLPDGLRKFRRFAHRQHTQRDIDRLLADEGIIRNRLKIESTIRNAQGALKIIDEHGSLDAFLWSYVDGHPIQNTWKSMKELPTQTMESEAMSRDLKKLEFNFVGPTICYAFMQAVGMVNDHTIGCYRYREIFERSD